MKKSVAILFSAIMIVSSVWVPQKCEAVAEASADSWDGTVDISWYTEEENTFSIRSGKQLAGLAKLVNEGNNFAGKEIHLAKDIYLNDTSLSTKNTWVPIGKGKDIEDTEYSFQGEFYGEGHTIYNIFVSAKGLGGLFGCIGESGIVCGVLVSQGRCDSGGIIANCNKGIIKFCSNNSIVGTTDYDVGGICNTNYNLVYGCENLGEVWGSDAAGIVGKNMKETATINQCRNKGKVASSDASCGIVVANIGWVYNCYNVGYLCDNFGSPNIARSLAGIVDVNNSTVVNCYSSCTYEYSEEDCWWVYGISREETENCYYYSEEEIGCGDAEKVDLAEMKKASFVQKLLPKTKKYNLVNSWNMDEGNSNNGLPITDADIQRKNGTYKCQPEIWMSEDCLEKAEGDSVTLPIQFYFADSKPNIYFDNEELGTVEYEGDETGGNIVLHFQKEGQGKLCIELPETKAVSGYLYSLDVSVISKQNDDPVEESEEILIPPAPPIVEVVVSTNSSKKDDIGKTTGYESGEEIEYTTVLSQTQIRKIKCLKGGKIRLAIKKSSNASGYQIVYSTNKKFKSKKTKNVAKTTVTLSKLKKKKTYYIKVRAYARVNGKKVYGKWSAVKKVKIKK